MDLTIQQSDLAFAAGRALGSVSTKSPLRPQFRQRRTK